MNNKNLENKFREFVETNKASLLKQKPGRQYFTRILEKNDLVFSQKDLDYLIKKYKPFSKFVHNETEIDRQAERINIDITTARSVWIKNKPDENGVSASFLCKNPLFNEQGFDFEDFKNNLLREINLESSFVIEKSKPQDNSEDEILLVFSLPDLHVGKVPIEDIEKAVYKAVSNLFSRINFKTNKYRILFITGNDLLNSDFDYRTTKGTPQFDVSEYYVSFVDAIRIIKNVVDSLKKLAPLEIINVPGNHDRNRGFYLGEVINAMYNELPVDNKFEPRKYYKFGKSLLGFEHGELKAEDYPLLMVTEKPVEFSKTTYHEWFLGHYHGEQTKEVKGFKMRYLPSLTSHKDIWHNYKGFVNNKRCAMIYKYDFNEGLIGTEVFNLGK